MLMRSEEHSLLRVLTMRRSTGRAEHQWLRVPNTGSDKQTVLGVGGWGGVTRRTEDNPGYQILLFVWNAHRASKSQRVKKMWWFWQEALFFSCICYTLSSLYLCCLLLLQCVFSHVHCPLPQSWMYPRDPQSCTTRTLPPGGARGKRGSLLLIKPKKGRSKWRVLLSRLCVAFPPTFGTTQIFDSNRFSETGSFYNFCDFKVLFFPHLCFFLCHLLVKCVDSVKMWTQTLENLVI